MSTNTLKLIATASAAALLAGCAGAWNGANEAKTVAEEHPISVDSQVVTLTIDIDPSATELTGLNKARLRAFADSYLNGGHGPLTVTAPSGTSNDVGARDLAANIRDYLNEVGVDWAAINGASYRAGDDRGTEVILSYTHYVATPSACGIWQGLKARDFANRQTPNFGCASQNNLAAMVADPRDLVVPADGAPADAQQRIRGVKLFREGEVTSTATDSDIKAEVAQ